MFDDRYNGLTLDEAAAKAGGYVDYVPGRSLILDYDYRAMSDYMTFAITSFIVIVDIRVDGYTLDKVMLILKAVKLIMMIADFHPYAHRAKRFIR